jgi:predicted aldo/keto reductase-like oxidoreductase
MSVSKERGISRREFVCQAGSAAMAFPVVSALAAESSPKGAAGELPRRVLGRTNLSVTCMTLGTAPCGISSAISVQQVADVVNAALDLGINSIDTSPKYGKAEQGVGLGLGRRRKDVILATKVWADTVADAEAKLSSSLKTLKTDYADLLYFHHLGDRDVKHARDSEGVFTWLVKQKKAGRCRFVGISGHNLPGRFAPFLETGEVDVILVNLNYIDRYTYNFEEKVLPLARKHNAGIVAMKVFGGPDPKQGSWGDPNARALVGSQNAELAIRYALSLPGVATANLGVHNVDQVRENVEIVKRFQALSAAEQEKVTRLGRELAPRWKDHFGPVEEKPA